jgi:hypothetical protein
MTWRAEVTGRVHNASNIRCSIAPKVRPNVSTATRSTASIAVVVCAGRAASDYTGIVYLLRTEHVQIYHICESSTCADCMVTGMFVIKNCSKNTYASVISAQETCVCNDKFYRLQRAISSEYVASATRVFTLGYSSRHCLNGVFKKH